MIALIVVNLLIVPTIHAAAAGPKGWLGTTTKVHYPHNLRISLCRRQGSMVLLYQLGI